MALSDEANMWMVQAKEEAVNFLDRILSWLDSIQNFEQLLQQWTEDSENWEKIMDENPVRELAFDEL